MEEMTLKLDGKELSYVNTVKYLGITLDSRLSFGPHIKDKITKAKKYLFSLRGSIGKIWGPGPEQILWIWNAVVKPAITYGSIVWATNLTKGLRNKLNKVQRLALTQVGHVRKSTPESGLDVILGQIPLDLHILEQAVQARLRTKGKVDVNWNGKGTGKRTSHFAKLDELIEEYNLTDKVDNQPTTIDWNQEYRVNLDSLGHGNDIKEGLRLYTDGSKMDMDTGYGAIFYEDEAITDTLNGKLEDHATVFQAECTAVQEGLTLLNNAPRGASVQVLTDNQALVQALANKETSSESVSRTKTLLNSFGTQFDITIHWIKAHNNYEGNEMADMLAKDGAKGLGTGPLIRTKMATKVAKSIVTNHIIKEWDNRWKKGKDARQTRIFFPTINLSKSKKIREMNRENIGNIIRAITGHDFRKRHEGLVRGVEASNCRFCHNEEETSSHIIDSCPRLAEKRMEIFKTSMGSKVTPTWQPEQLAAFLSDPTISEMEVPEWEY